MSQHLGKVTVVIATRNRGKYLHDSLFSILSQDIEMEVRVVRTLGDSEVPSVSLVSDRRVTVMECTHSHRGVEGWIVGLTGVTTPWSMTFDDDDLMFPGSLPRLISMAEEHGLEMAAAAVARVGPHFKQDDFANINIDNTYIRGFPEVVPFTWDDLGAGMIPGMGTAAWSSRLNRSVIECDTVFGSDSSIATELFAASKKSAFCRLFLRAHRQHQGSISEIIGGANMELLADEYSSWASARFPEFAAARNRAFASGRNVQFVAGLQALLQNDNLGHRKSIQP